MKNPETPKWLIDGAFQSWSNKTSFFKKVLLYSAPIELVMYFTIWTILFYGFDVKPSVFIGFVIIVPILFLGEIVIRVVTKRLKRKYGNSPEWQRKYLQSRIDEAVSYEKSMPQLMNDASVEASEKISEMSRNLTEMLKKKTEAEELLQQL